MGENDIERVEKLWNSYYEKKLAGAEKDLQQAEERLALYHDRPDSPIKKRLEREVRDLQYRVAEVADELRSVYNHEEGGD